MRLPAETADSVVATDAKNEISKVRRESMEMAPGAESECADQLTSEIISSLIISHIAYGVPVLKRNQSHETQN